MAVDHIGSLVAFLRADSAVAAKVGTRVFGGELPRLENKHMPRAAVVVAPAGGPGLIGSAYQDFGDKRVDVDCYGATGRASYLLYLDTHRALKHLQREIFDGVLLHWARVSAGGVTTRDPRTDWPVTVASWQVLAAEIPIPA